MRKLCSAALLLLLLPPACSASYPLRDPVYIQIFCETKQNWDQARSICRQNHSDLVTIRSAEENSFLVELAGWIGLHQRNESAKWIWSRGDEVAEYVTWKKDHPKDKSNCTFKMADELQWLSLPCNYVGPFICAEDRVILVKEEKTWEEALAHCRALALDDSITPDQDFNDHHYDLVSLLHQDDIDFAHEKAEGGTTDEVWTGLRFIAGHWLWVDGEPVQAGQQIPAEPTPGSQGSCGALGTRSTDSIQARDCALRKNFLCYHSYHFGLKHVDNCIHGL